jgi:hypothetical protein
MTDKQHDIAVKEIHANGRYTPEKGRTFLMTKDMVFYQKETSQCLYTRNMLKDIHISEFIDKEGFLAAQFGDPITQTDLFQIYAVNETKVILFDKETEDACCYRMSRQGNTYTIYHGDESFTIEG